LFLKGGDQYQFSVQDHGLIYLVNFPFLLIGLSLLLVLVGNKNKASLFLLLWFLIAPIPASITRESPHVLRTITMIPIPMIMTSFGIFSVLSIKQLKQKSLKKGLLTIYLLVLALSFAFYLNRYISDYNIKYSWSWQYGYKKVVEFTKDVYTNYDKIIITKKYGEPHIFYLFYWPWNPKNYINDDNLVRFEQSDWFWVDRFDKFYFVNDWDIPKRSDEDFILESGEEFDCRNSKCLLITSPGNYQRDWKLLKTIYFLDNTPAFEILEL
jgi:hypothetical protein